MTINDRGNVPAETHRRRLRHLFAERGIVRSRDLDASGIPRKELSALLAGGEIERVSRGIYSSTEVALDANQSLAEAAARIPNGVICLLSALQLHGMTTRIAHEVWVAIDRKAWKPAIEDLPVRIVRFSPETLRTGIEERRILGIDISVTTPAKTVADCFKFRKQVGLDLAIEALRDYLLERRGSADELWRMVNVCRVERLMRPYIEALL
jgi:predicted transcriptional regulator of viral defense system